MSLTISGKIEAESFEEAGRKINAFLEKHGFARFDEKLDLRAADCWVSGAGERGFFSVEFTLTVKEANHDGKL